MTEIRMEIAQLADKDRVLNFIREFYYQEEPITVFHPTSGQTKDDEEFSMSHLASETVLMAFDKDKMVGALIAGPITQGDADEMLAEAQITETKKWADILRLLAFIEQKADVCNKFSVARALHIHVVGVHHGYRGHQIGQKLYTKCFENAKAKQYPLVSVDCTSLYSIKIAEKLGMEFVSEVSYKEYHEFMGENIFKPVEPHTVIKTFVKKICQSN